MRPEDSERTQQLDARELLRQAQEANHPTGATLTSVSGPHQGRVYMLRRGANLLGRSPAAIVQVNAVGVSRMHAQIVEADGAYTLTDMGSANGTICRGQLVEEFAVLCRDTSATSARVLADRLRQTIERFEFEWKGQEIPVTVSVGVATSLEAEAATTEDLVALADGRLYQAKQAGRNRTVAPDRDGNE